MFNFNKPVILIVLYFFKIDTYVNGEIRLAENHLHSKSAPKKLTDCKAQLDNGKIVDLSPLDNNQMPR